MALGLRPVNRVPLASSVYERYPKNIVDMIGAHKMVGLLKQIGQLSEFAAEIFGTLFKEAHTTIGRIGALNARVQAMERSTPEIENVFATVAPSTFYQSAGGKPWRRDDMVSGSLLSPSTQPASIASFRASVNPPPKVSQLDELAKRDCLKTYSDPQFFLEQWLKAEEERQRILIEQNRARQAEKKKNKKKKQQKEKKAVAAVQVKQYNQFGELIVTNNTTAATPAQQQQSAADDDGDDDADENQLRAAIAAAPKKQAAPMPTPTQSQARPSNINNTPPQGSMASPPTPPGGPSAYAAPPPPPMMGSPYDAPPVAPPFEAPPMAPAYDAPPMSSPYAAPPMAPAFDAPPMAPPFEAPPFEAPPFEAPPFDAPAPDDTSSSGGGGGGSSAPPSANSLLGQIQGGFKLRSATERKQAPAPPRPTDTRGGMLAEIRNRNFALKKVEAPKEEEAPKKAAQMGGAMGSIMDILARRAAIKGSDDEDGSGGDDWE